MDSYTGGLPELLSGGSKGGFSWLTNLRKGAVGGAWGLLAALVLMFIDKVREYSATGAVTFGPDDQQVLVLVVTPAVVWVTAQVNNLIKNYPGANGLWGLLKMLLPCLLLCAALVGAGPCPTLSEGQQNAMNALVGAIVREGFDAYDASQASEAARAEYKAAKETLKRAAVVGAAKGYAKLRAGGTKDEALAASKAGAEFWCGIEGTSLAEVMVVVKRGAPPKVDTGDILEAVLREQLEIYVRSQAAELLPNADPDAVSEAPVPNATGEIAIAPLNNTDTGATSP